MDDFLSSFHEISVAMKVCVDVTNILQKGVFQLTKFISNNPSLLQALPTSNNSPTLTEMNLSVNDIPIERALGILWKPETDTFHIKYTLKSVLTTKRGILSLISSIFDPLGFIAPSTALRCGSFPKKKNIEKKHLYRHDKNYYYFWKSNIPVINLIVDSRNMIKVSKNMVHQIPKFLCFFYCF